MREVSKVTPQILMDRVLGSRDSSNASSNGSIMNGCTIECFNLRVHLHVSAFVLVHKGFVRESGPYHVRVSCEAGHITGGKG